jgi:hypothetical protein
VAGNARNAAALVAAGGLKAVFPSFMGAGAAHTRRYHGEDGVAEEEEQVVALVASLVALLPPTGSGAGAAPAAGEAWLRLLAKFREDGGAKLHRLVDLYVTAADRVAAAEAEADADGGDDDEDEDAGDGADDDDIETDAVAEAKVSWGHYAVRVGARQQLMSGGELECVSQTTHRPQPLPQPFAPPLTAA